MSRVIHTDQAGSITGARIVLDTNIWVMIEGFNQAAPPSKVEAYSYAYDRLLRNGNVILYNDAVINEFYNTCARIAFNAHGRGNEGGRSLSFKEFRRSPAYEPVAAAIREACLTITETCTYVPVELYEIDIKQIVEKLSVGRLDFTDLVLVRFCQARNTILMTDDADFAEEDLTIISANRRLQISSKNAERSKSS